MTQKDSYGGGYARYARDILPYTPLTEKEKRERRERGWTTRGWRTLVRPAYNRKGHQFTPRGYRSSHELFIKVVAAYGGVCACCSEKEILLLTIDHVNNDGKQERHLCWKQYYQKVLDEISTGRYQLLCYSCNIGKYRNGGVCPHQKV